jgi:uncharacterized membrane protein
MLSRIRDWLGPVSLALALVYTILHFSSLPAQVPLHFGITGNPDSWGQKAFIFSLPFLGVALWFGLTLVKRLPHTFNYPIAVTPENRDRQRRLALGLIDWVRCETALLFAFLTYQQISVAMGRRSNLDMIAMIALIVWINLTIVVYLVLATKRASDEFADR